MTAFAAELELALEAARRAGTAVRARFGGVQAVRYKDPDQPVTEADLEADALLREVLLGGGAGYGWLSEESPAGAAEGALSWVVDPIDGTSSFAAGIPEFAISIGLVRGSEPVLGVVYNPIAGSLYSAASGGGAFRNGVPIRVRASSERVLAVSRFERERGAFAAFTGWELYDCGSTALKMCRVAEGSADGFVSFGPKHLWDICGAAVVLREAGGVAVDLAGRAMVPPSGPGPWRGMVAAAPPHVDDLSHLAALAAAGRAG